MKFKISYKILNFSFTFSFSWYVMCTSTIIFMPYIFYTDSNFPSHINFQNTRTYEKIHFLTIFSKLFELNIQCLEIKIAISNKIKYVCFAEFKLKQFMYSTFCLYPRATCTYIFSIKGCCTMFTAQ